MIIHGAITGHTPGNMVGGFEPQREHNAYAGEYVPCPTCGEPMRYTSKLCHDCHTETLGQITSVERAARQERQELWDLALAAGWTVAQLYGGKFDPDEPKKVLLPTRTEIVNRMIENWRGTMVLNKAQKARRYILACHGHSITVKDVRQGLRNKISRSTITRALNLLDEEGAVQKRGKGRTKHWYVEPRNLF